MTLEKLIQLLRTAEEPEQINGCREDIAQLIPKVRIMFDFDQRNDAHQYDLWMHCIHTVLGLPRSLEDGMLYLAALLHDIGKPDCQVPGTREGDTDMHYYGHPARSEEIVREEVIPGLVEKGVTEDDRRRLLYYVAYHDDRVGLLAKHVKRHLEIPVSFHEFQNLMLLEVADAKAHVQIPIVVKRVEVCSALAGEDGRALYQRVMEEK